MKHIFLPFVLSVLMTPVFSFAAGEVAGPVQEVESTEKVLPEFPKFQYKGTIFGYENLKYRPHDDFTFISVFPAHKHFEKPLGKYYMYYAAHDPPAEISLAYADNFEGPWTEYKSNPIILRDWEPHYKVSHVSSPDAFWVEDEKKLFVYYHGENNVTRYAVSTDGIHFEYGAEAVNLTPHGIVESSYSRVAEFAMPGKDSRYIMITMGNDRETFKINPVGIRMCYLSTSVDGRVWESDPEPLLTPPPGTDQITPGCYLRWNNRNFIIATANLIGGTWDPISNFYLYELDAKLQNPKLQGVLLDRGVVAPEHRRLSSPCILIEDGKIHMFFTIGKRCNEKPAYAVAEF